MNEYLLKLMGICLLSIIITACLPGKKAYSLIKNIIRLCLYVIIIAPIATFCMELTKTDGENFSKIFPNYFSKNVIETDEKYIKYCSEKSLENAELALSQKLFEDYQICIEVEIILKNTNLYEIEKICLVFNEDYDELLAQSLKGRLETECSVPVEILKEVKA